MIHDDALLDDIAVLALGSMPEPEARRLAEHIRACVACQAEYASLRSTADLIGYGAEMEPGGLSELAALRLKSRVMTAVRTDLGATANSHAEVDATTTPSRNGSVVPARGRALWLVYGGAVAAALIAVVSLFDDAAQRSTTQENAARIAVLERDVASADARTRALDSRVAQLIAPGSKHFAVPGGEIIASNGRVIMAMRDLPALPQGKVYQAWTLTKGAKAVAPSITFSPDARGVAIVELPEGAANLVAVAVSVEPTGGSRKPTSKPSFVRALS